MEPCIKGVGMQLAVNGLRHVMDAGLLSREQLEARLEPADLKILDEKILPGIWYPIGTCARLIELAVEVEGNDPSDYLVRVGKRAAEEMFTSEVYESYLSSAEKWGHRSGRVMLGLTKLVLNFSQWSYDPGLPGNNSFTVEVTEAADFPDVLRYLAQGFIAYLASRVDPRPVVVISERPSPDRVLFKGRRMPQPGASPMARRKAT
jgi:hypothetical protein